MNRRHYCAPLFDGTNRSLRSHGWAWGMTLLVLAPVLANIPMAHALPCRVNATLSANPPSIDRSKHKTRHGHDLDVVGCARKL